MVKERRWALSVDMQSGHMSIQYAKVAMHWVENTRRSEHICERDPLRPACSEFMQSNSNTQNLRATNSDRGEGSGGHVLFATNSDRGEGPWGHVLLSTNSDRGKG